MRVTLRKVVVEKVNSRFKNKFLIYNPEVVKREEKNLFAYIINSLSAALSGYRTKKMKPGVNQMDLCDIDNHYKYCIYLQMNPDHTESPFLNRMIVGKRITRFRLGSHNKSLIETK